MEESQKRDAIETTTAPDDAPITLLSQDLQEEVLFRLSCKHRYRARCVSKTWNNLISSASDDRRRQPLTIPGGIFMNCSTPRKSRTWKYYSSSTEKEDRGLSLEFLPFCNEQTFKINHTCNGLVLCSNINSVLEAGIRGLPNVFHIITNFYLCNPLTMKWINVCQRARVHVAVSAALAFDPPPNYISGEYRVKIIFFLPPKYKPKVAVFSSETGKWVDKFPNYVDDKIAGVSSDPKTPWFYLNGVLYKLARSKSSDDQEDIVLCYHIEENRLSSVDLPEKDNICRESKGTGLGSCMDGCLNLTIDILRGGTRMLTIWRLEEDGGKYSWVPLHEIPIDVFTGELGRFGSNAIFFANTYPHDQYSNFLSLPAVRVFMVLQSSYMINKEEEMHIFRYNLTDKSIEKLPCPYTDGQPKSKKRYLLFPFSPQPLPLPWAGTATPPLTSV